MAHEAIPEDIRRFVLTSIASVPHLEALLLLRNGEKECWTTTELAQRLYIGEKVAATLLTDLAQAGIVVVRKSEASQAAHCYDPSSPSLRSMIDRLAELYARHLLEITHLIHSRLDRKAHQFADAFKWRKDT